MKWKLLNRVGTWAATLAFAAGCAAPDRAAFFGKVPQSPVEPRTARRVATSAVDEVVEESSTHRAGSTLDHDPASSADAKTSPDKLDQFAQSSTPADDPPEASAPQTPKKPPSLDSAALTSVLKELQDLGTLEPDAQARLMQDLQKTDPALWPQIVTYFKATLAYQKKLQSAATGAPATELAAKPITHQEIAPSPIQVTPDSQQAAQPQEPARLATAPIERLPVATADERAPVEQKSPAAAPAVAPPIAALPPAPHATALSKAAAPEPAAVRQATFEQPLPATADPSAAADPIAKPYDEQLRSMILALEAQSRQAPGDIDRELNLRMLYLLASRGEDALRPIAGMPPEQQDFWSKQLYGLHTLFDPHRASSQDVRWAEASQHLGEATARLRESASLAVRNLAFCTEVGSFGVYKQFASHTFAPNQEVLLYAEVENLKSQLVPEGFRTELTSHYEIFDKQGTRVDEKDFGITQEVCRNRRRDFFIRYQFNLPKRLHNGNYSLKLTVEDKHGEKIGQSSIDFTIKGAE